MTTKLKGRIFSGMRPSGRLHLGNLLGALQNWVALQDDYECVYSIADVHALTTLTDGHEAAEIAESVNEIALDWLAGGLDPNRSIIFVQSHVPEVLTLHTLLSMVTPLGWLLRVPTFKDRVRQMDETEESVSYGLVGYPVLQTADIILYKADTVPVGSDQVAHLEIAREIVRRFNHMFGPTFPEPKAKLTPTPLVVGLDGHNKMSKSMDNHIELAATAEETAARLRTAFTDPERLRRNDPGRPEVCNIYSLHKFFNADDVQEIYDGCTSAATGCVDCKAHLADGINNSLKSFRERRQELAAQPRRLKEILADGAKKASAIAKETILEVRERLGISIS
tara:strand:+ start:319 stop:1329 length:1011 start_codon:yes stop_codon:yes gene_type:complete